MTTPSVGTMTCSEIRERIVDGDESAALRAHVEGCAECRPILAALLEVDEGLAALPEIDAPDALVARTLARASEERADDAPVTVGAPSLLAAAFAMLTSAVGALVVAPLIALRWLLGVGTERKTSASIEDRGKRGDARAFRFPMAPALAMSSLLIGIIAFTTFSRFGATVKTKTRGAEAVVNGLPTSSSDGDGLYEANERGRDDGWWMDEEEAAPTPAFEARVQAAPIDPATTQDVDGRYQQLQPDIALDGLVADMPAAGDVLLPRTGFDGQDEANVDTQTGTFQWNTEGETVNGTEDLEQTELPAHHGAVRGPTGSMGPTEHSAESGEAFGQLADRTIAVAEPPAPAQGIDLRTTPRGVSGGLRGEVSGELAGGLGGELDRGGRVLEEDLDGDDGIAFRSAETQQQAAPSAWDLAQVTTGLTFASSESWWSNTYVPGDARLRMLHARLAASPGTLAGATTSALALAESASPTTPAVAAPTDRALALGVHADTTAIEGPTRVRMEIALRAIDQAAGRRGALRIALVVDARSPLGTEEQAHLRALLASLSRSLSPRDRVILTAAGPGGGTLVPLGVLRHGQVEVALRHLGEIGLSAGEAIPTSLDAALASGLEAVATEDDGAGLTLLVTPNGAHDAAVDQALHLGAVAGVPTTAVGIGAAASTESLDAIALAGEGRRRLVLSDDDAARTVREELVAASRLVARAMRVRVHLADGVQLVEVVGAHALDADETRRTRESERAIDQSLARRLGIGQDRDDDDSGIRILVPSFYAGDSHTIVLDLLVARPGPVADVDVRFKDLVRLGNGTASSALALEAGTAPRGPRELRVVASWLGQETASALDEAASAMDRGDLGTARTRLAAARALVTAARTAVPGLEGVASIRTDGALLDRFASAVDGATDPALVATSLHYAAARRIVIPQLQASAP